MKFDIDPGYIFLDCSYNFTLVNLIRCRECKKTSLTAGRDTPCMELILFLFPLFVIRNVVTKKIATCPES